MNEYGHGSDVIRLEDVWRVLVRHRWAALVALVGCMLAAALYLHFAKPLFESSVRVYIGSARGALLAQPTLVSQRIGQEFGKDARPGSSWVADISIDRREPRVMVIKVRGTSAEEAFSLAAEIGKAVVAEHASKLKEINQAAETELRDLRELAGMARNALNRIKSREALTKRPTANTPEILYSAVQLGVMVGRIGELEQLLRTDLVPSEVVQAPVVAKRPIFPGTRGVFALALFGGLILAFVAAFFAEAVAKRRGA